MLCLPILVRFVPKTDIAALDHDVGFEPVANLGHLAS
jgi:hypothetical protein